MKNLMAEMKEKAESTVRRIYRKTRRKHSSNDRIRIENKGLDGELKVAALYRKKGLSQSL